MNLLYFLMVGLIAGWLAGKIIKGKGFGTLGNLIIGCIGAVLGGYLFHIFGIFTYGFIGSLITALGGALVLIWLIGLITKK